MHLLPFLPFGNSAYMGCKKIRQKIIRGMLARPVEEALPDRKSEARGE
jgi:hypothetical protein